MTDATDADLYERDFYAWTQVQAERLRELRGHNTVDIEHVAEEIADLGTSQRNALASHARLAFQHVILLVASDAEEPRGHWADEIENHRNELRQLLEASPSLRRSLELDKPWRRAVRAANQKLAWHGEPMLARQVACPLHLDELESEQLSVTDLVQRVRDALADPSGG